jgi:hypothetical protein
MIELLLKSPINNTVIFSNQITINYEVRDTEGVFDKVSFTLYDKNSTLFKTTAELSPLTVTGRQRIIVSNQTSLQNYFYREEKVTRTDLFNIENVPEGEYYLVAVVLNKYGKEILSTKKTINFSLKPITIEVKNKLSSVVSSSIPNFLEREYELFTDFIKQYYRWLESSKNVNYIPHNLEQLLDIDSVPPELIDKFYETYLPLLPRKFATDKESGLSLDIKKVVKNIRDFYSKKGTEDSFRFLFRVMFDTEITLSYPKEKMLFTSGSVWVKPIIIRINGLTDTFSADIIGKTVYTLNASGNVNFSADIDDTIYTFVENLETTTAFLNNVVGNLETDYVYIDVVREGVVETQKLKLIRMVTKVEPKESCPFYGFKIGDRVKLTPDGQGFHTCVGPSNCNEQRVGSFNLTRQPGYSFLAYVEKVNDQGEIQKVKILDPGVGFDGPLNSRYDIVIGDRNANCKLTLYGGYIFYHEGYYLNKNSLLSEIAYLQDNFYYQLNSYEIGSNITPYRYSDILKQNVHPAGYQPFYRYDILDFISEKFTINTVSNFGSYIISGAIDEDGNVVALEEDIIKGESEQVSPSQDVGLSQISFFKSSSYEIPNTGSTDIISTDEQNTSSTDYILSINEIEPLDFAPVSKTSKLLL